MERVFFLTFLHVKLGRHLYEHKKQNIPNWSKETAMSQRQIRKSLGEMVYSHVNNETRDETRGGGGEREEKRALSLRE